jgi:putative hydrolase of the HAD superfamily
MPTYQHLFFDLDRTLWDMEHNARATLVDLFRKHELEARGIPSVDIFITHYHHYNDLLWERYRKKQIGKDTLRALRFRQSLAHFGIKDHELAKQFEIDYLTEAPLKTQLIPGAIELMNTLSGKYAMHIITNGFDEVQRNKIQSSGLAPFIQGIFTSESCGLTKPDRRMFDFALRKTGATAENSLMIGDDLHVDIVGAREAGWHQVYLNPNQSKHEEEVTYQVRELHELIPILG